MKTVIDAVNELEANVLNIQNYNETKKSIRFNEDDEDEYLGFFLSNFDKQSFSDFVCTVDEFNACVAELSAATWIDGVSLNEWRVGMKNTVIDSNGNQLEIGKVYEFSDNARVWFASSLVLLVDSEYQYKTQNTSWRFIRECQSPLGTIKKSPVKLVDGKAYQFENVVTGRVWVGFYNSTNDRFDESVGGIGVTCHIGNVSCFKNIIPLVPETK